MKPSRFLTQIGLYLCEIKELKFFQIGVFSLYDPVSVPLIFDI